MIGIPQCSHCLRFRDDVRDNNVCEAFPDGDGIPEEIILGEFDHSKPFPGDRGLRFEESGVDAAMAEDFGEPDGGEEERLAALDEGEDDGSVELVGRVEKIDEDKRLVFGWFSVISIGGRKIEDTQGDVISPETLEVSAYDYVLRARKGGEMHETNKSDEVKVVAKLVESVVFTREKQRAMEKTLRDQGVDAQIDLGCVAWWGGFKVLDDGAWKRVKSGELKAFSIGGRGKREKIEKSEDLEAALLEDFGPPPGELEEDVEKYSEDQPRDEQGRWTSGGGGEVALEGRRSRPLAERGLGARGREQRAAIKELMSRQGGATAGEIIAATGWRNVSSDHLAGMRRAGFGIGVTRNASGERVYLVTSRPQPGEGARTNPDERKEMGYLKGKVSTEKVAEISNAAIRCPEARDFEQRTGLTPKEYTAALLGRFDAREIRDMRAEYTPIGSSSFTSELHMTVRGEDGSLSNVSMSRSLDLESKTVNHSYFSISTSEGGRRVSGSGGAGIGKKLFDASLDLYDHMGIKRIDVHANIDVGGYAWARYGFVPTQRSWDTLRSNLSARVDYMTLSPRLKDSVRRVLDDSNPESIGVLAALKDRAPNGEPLGKALLKNTDWHGSIKLTDKNRYARVRAYTKGK